MPNFEIVCLANSRKRQGCCIAGLKTDGTGWVRPVGAGEEGSLVPSNCRLPDGSAPRLLDVVRVCCDKPCPKPHQPENWTLGSGRWELVARPTKPFLEPILESAIVAGPLLFGTFGDRAPYGGMMRSPTQASLALIAPTDLRWQIRLNEDFKPRTRALFRLGYVRYDLSVTDPVWERRLRPLPEGEYDLIACGVGPNQKVLLTVSLGEPFHGDCYKLVAGIIII